MSEQIIQNQELLKQYEERLEKSKVNYEVLFDRAESQGKTPFELMEEEAGEKGWDISIKLYGKDKIEEFKQKARKLKFKDRDDFINQMMDLTAPLIYSQYFDSEVRKRHEEIFPHKEFKAGKLDITIHPSKWEFKLSDGTEVNKTDKVAQIGWPIEEEKPSGNIRKILREVQDSFRQISKILDKEEEVKAVIAVSWMMADKYKKLTERFGFEKIKDIKIDTVDDILEMAEEARAEKGYKKKITEEDVGLGVITRERFLKMHGNNKNND